MNKIIITGRLGDDPKGQFFNRKTDNAEMVKATFNLAIRTASSDSPLWLQVQAFNALAEKVIIPYVRKGDMVLVEGELRQNIYEGKKFHYVLAEKLEIISNKKQEIAQLDDEVISEDEIINANTDDSDLIL